MVEIFFRSASKANNTSDSPLLGSYNWFIKLLSPLFLPTPSPPAFVSKGSSFMCSAGITSVLMRARGERWGSVLYLVFVYTLQSGGASCVCLPEHTRSHWRSIDLWAVLAFLLHSLNQQPTAVSGSMGQMEGLIGLILTGSWATHWSLDVSYVPAKVTTKVWGLQKSQFTLFPS